jgi:hypothetical protein
VTEQDGENFVIGLVIGALVAVVIILVHVARAVLA